MPDAFNLAISLEARGVRMREEAGDLIVWPKSHLTAVDRETIQHHKAHLIQIVRYARSRCER